MRGFAAVCAVLLVVSAWAGGWKARRFERAYENSRLRLEVRVPGDWKLKENPTSLIWTAKGREGEAFAIHWLNPDHIYDVESICRSGMCVDEAPLKAASGLKLRIARPTAERRAAMGLSKDFLFAEPLESKERITFWFTTDHLPIGMFKKVLSTFSRNLDDQ